MAFTRASRSQPCPVCGGHPDLPRGQGVRCTGFTTDEGWIHCTREELAGHCRRHEGGVEPTYSHRAEGECPCGQEHAPAPIEPGSGRRSPRRASGAEVRQIGEARRAEVVATYDYRDKNGRLLYQVCRMHPKSFRQRRPGANGEWIWNLQGVTPTLYRIPELIPGLLAGDTVWICEGEKDVEAMFAAGQVATCNTGGAGKWRDALSGAFERFAQPGAEIRIIQDRDPEFDAQGKPHRRGQKHARQVYESLVAALPKSVSVAIYESPEHHDAADHLAAGLPVERFVQVWPFPEDLMERDLQAFKRTQIRAALEARPRVLERISRDHKPTQQPVCPTGLVGCNALSEMQGAVVLAAEPSTGKSYFAMSTAIAACNAGWEVFYLSCEMHEDIVFDRAVRALAASSLSRWDFRDQRRRNEALLAAGNLQIPDALSVVNVEIGVTIDALVELLAQNVSERPTLVVLDSLSSFVDNLQEEDRRDTFKMGIIRRVVQFATATRRLTHGHVAWLLLSEINQEGKAKGRFLEHRCDIGLAITSDKEQGHVKRIRVTKSWWGPTGPLGDFVLDWELSHLRKCDPDMPPAAPYPEEDAGFGFD